MNTNMNMYTNTQNYIHTLGLPYYTGLCYYTAIVATVTTAGCPQPVYMDVKNSMSRHTQVDSQRRPTYRPHCVQKTLLLNQPTRQSGHQC